MTYEEFGSEFCGVVGELWNRWALREWNEANQQVVWHILKPFDCKTAIDRLRHQRFAEPDGIRPNWSALRSDLRSHKSAAAAGGEQEEEAVKARRDSAAIWSWSRAMGPERLAELESRLMAEHPRMVAIFAWLNVCCGRLGQLYALREFERGNRFGFLYGPRAADRQGVLGL